VERAPEAQPHCNLGSHLFALLRAGSGQLRVHQSKSHRGGLQLSNLNALRSDVRYLANSALPTVIGLNRLGLDGGPLRSPIIHHGSAWVRSSQWHSIKGRAWDRLCAATEPGVLSDDTYMTDA